VEVTLLIAQVNAWNRIKIGLRAIHPADEKWSRADFER
jgi:alkylhydroperoxidase family enzyme